MYLLFSIVFYNEKEKKFSLDPLLDHHLWFLSSPIVSGDCPSRFYLRLFYGLIISLCLFGFLPRTENTHPGGNLPPDGNHCFSTHAYSSVIYTASGRKIRLRLPVQEPSNDWYWRGNCKHTASRTTSLMILIASGGYGEARMTEMMDVQCSWVILETEKRRCWLAKTIEGRAESWTDLLPWSEVDVTIGDDGLGRIPVLSYEC